MLAFGSASYFFGFDDGGMDESSFGTSFRFVAFMNDLNDRGCSETSSFTLSDVSWKIRICKRIEAGKSDNLDIYLDSDIQDSSLMVEASGDFELLRNGNDPNNYFRHSLPWRKFTAATPSHGVINFLLTTPLNNYLNDGRLRFQFDITTKPVEKIDFEYEMEYLSTKIRAIIKNVNQLTNTSYSVSTRETILRGIRWNVLVKLQNESLAVFLNANDDDLEEDFQTKVTAVIKLLPFNRAGHCPEPLRIEAKPTFHKGLSSHQVNLLAWNNFVRPASDYIVKNSAALVVEIKVGGKQRVSHFNF